MNKKEYMKEYLKGWRKKNKEKTQKYQKEYREKNKISLNKYFKDYYLKNREHKIQYQREQYEKNGAQQNITRRNKKRAYQKRYTQNPNNQLKIKARIITKPISIVGLCEICETMPATEKHHKDYNNPNEIQFVCSSCHRQIHGYGLIAVGVN